MLALDGKQVERTFTIWPPLGQKMGEPSASVPGGDEDLISEPSGKSLPLALKLVRMGKNHLSPGSALFKRREPPANQRVLSQSIDEEYLNDQTDHSLSGDAVLQWYKHY